MNVFRKEYRELNPDEVNALVQIKNKAQELYDLMKVVEGKMREDGKIQLIFNSDAREVAAGKASGESFVILANGRCVSLAKTKLEESVMWLTKGITE